MTPRGGDAVRRARQQRAIDAQDLVVEAAKAAVQSSVYFGKLFDLSSESLKSAGQVPHTGSTRRPSALEGQMPGWEGRPRSGLGVGTTTVVRFGSDPSSTPRRRSIGTHQTPRPRHPSRTKYRTLVPKLGRAGVSSDRPDAEPVGVLPDDVPAGELRINEPTSPMSAASNIARSRRAAPVMAIACPDHLTRTRATHASTAEHEPDLVQIGAHLRCGCGRWRVGVAEVVG